ncbi:hypothetical protein [Gorillibacterium massiliense]|uniref:hypothetical protein n=1 Tax=Gorillibacterium massiliense TaxID=1280390 RepID=UPI0004ACC34C|nr:hypothetical protein [Gorillibacterium massiliense]
MDFYMKLPRNKKEFALFMAVISVISVNMIAPLITAFEVGFSMDTWGDTMKVIPSIWFAVVAIVLITYKPAEWLTSRVAKKGDSFGAHMMVNVVFSVLLMSILLTVIGTWIGSRHISMEPIHLFFYKWPRNFAISFFVEAWIAQPIARLVMLKLHRYQDS